MCDHPSHTASAQQECPAPSAQSESCAVAECSEHPRLNDLTMSERTIHRTCWEAHRLGQVARLRFVRGLLAAEETELYLKLGFSTVHQYAKDQFKCEDTQAKEFLRVARLLHKLPLMTREFEEGRLSWSAFEVMSRVAKGKEKQWLTVLSPLGPPKGTVDCPADLQAHYRGARQGPEGLSQARAGALAESQGEATPAEGDLPLPHPAPPRDRSRRDSEGESREGVKGSAHEVEISPEEEWEVVVDDAQSPVIDKPNPPSLARKVCLRDGGCCANCKRKLGLQAHHVRFRAKGGRTVLANECCLCVSCHSLLHQGLLKLTGNPIDGITFHTRADDLTEEFTKELEEKISAVPVLIITPTKEDDPEPSPQAVAAGSGDSAPGASRDQGPQAAPADIGIPVDDPKAGVSISEAGRPASDMEAGRPAEEHEAVEMTKGALRNLGFTSREARERAEGARERLLRGGRASLTVADCGDLLREAFRSRWSKKRGPE